MNMDDERVNRIFNLFLFAAAIAFLIIAGILTIFLL